MAPSNTPGSSALSQHTGSQDSWLRCVRLTQQANDPSQNQYVCILHAKENQSGICGFIAQTGVMKRHVESVHTIRTLQCQYCGMAFPQQTLLEAHLSSHMAAVSQPCPHCGLMFTDPAVRIRHIFEKHGYVPNA